MKPIRKNHSLFRGCQAQTLGGILAMALTAVLISCNENGATTPPKGTDFPVNETLATELAAKGIPVDGARFFAAAKMESHCPNDTTCVYVQTFPNGSTRDMTLKVSPNRAYKPVASELVSGGAPIYAFKLAVIPKPDSTRQFDLDYYVLKSGLPNNAAVKTSAVGDGAGIAWTEIGKTGVDVAIGSVIDFYKDKGLKVGALGNIYALASAMSNVSTALDLSKQNDKWLKELDDLEKCAANPTNPIAKNTPGYSQEAVAKVQSARSELKEVNSVRFLNNMVETGSGLSPVTAVMSVGLKQGFAWSEQTLGDYSENTIMREVRIAVDSCKDYGLAGNVDVVWECTDTSPTITKHTVWHTVSEVAWIWSEMERKYVAQGSYEWNYTETSTGGGKTCVNKKKATGAIAGTGRLMVIDDPTAQTVLGFRYSASGQIETDVAAEYCTGTSASEPWTIDWLPYITGSPGPNGNYDGEMDTTSCIGNASSGREVTKWKFSVPPPK